MPGPEPEDHPDQKHSIRHIERLVADAIRLAREAHCDACVPDLEKCAIAASRAADSLSAPDGEEPLQHRLRNHLGAVQGYVELILEENATGMPEALRGALEALAGAVSGTLRRRADAPAPVARVAGAARRGNGNGPAGTVLVIDDSEQNRELLTRHLRHHGHRVRAAASGSEALGILRGEPIDLVFLDLVMPEMSGLELLTLIKADPALRAVPVIIVSGIDDDAGVIRCIEAGADDYLHKPFNPTLLQARLNAGLQRKRWHDREEAYRRELERNERFIRNTFGRYLSDEIVDALLETPHGLNLGGTTTRVTLLMSDIRNFSAICEHHAPEQVVQLLNNYLGVMSGIIMRHNGTVDEFIGDAILAIFGAPVRRDDDARRAVACALEMQQAVLDINRRNAELGLPEIGIGIGLNTGTVVAGNIGSEQRSKYAVVGHTVNLTARIESYTVAGEVLAAQSTLDEAGAAVTTGRRFTVRPKGMAGEVSVSAILDMKATAGSAA